MFDKCLLVVIHSFHTNKNKAEFFSLHFQRWTRCAWRLFQFKKFDELILLDGRIFILSFDHFHSDLKISLSLTMKLESIIPIKMDELGSKVKLSKRDNLGTKFDLPINLLYISVITIAIGLTIMIIIYWIAFINYAQIEIIQIKWPNKFWIIFIAIGLFNFHY